MSDNDELGLTAGKVPATSHQGLPQMAIEQMFGGRDIPIGLRVAVDPFLMERCKDIARVMKLAADG
jgi:hypothetical protein